MINRFYDIYEVFLNLNKDYAICFKTNRCPAKSLILHRRDNDQQ